MLLSDLLRNLHDQLTQGLELSAQASDLVSLRVDEVDTEIPLDLTLSQPSSANVYQTIKAKPPFPALGVKQDYRYSRIKIKWVVNYHD